jgi:hypothetical protein
MPGAPKSRTLTIPLRFFFLSELLGFTMYELPKETWICLLSPLKTLDTVTFWMLPSIEKYLYISGSHAVHLLHFSTVGGGLCPKNCGN